jgi:hypothetical protein
MKLSREQSQKLLRVRGIWGTEACDKCGQLLGSVRWTRKSEPGEWCSKECRDGVAAVEKRKAQRVGRPRLVLSVKARASRRRTQVREAVARHRLNVIKIICSVLNRTKLYARFSIRAIYLLARRVRCSKMALPQTQKKSHRPGMSQKRNSADALENFAKRVEERLRKGKSSSTLENLVCRIVTDFSEPQLAARMTEKLVEWRYGKAKESMQMSPVEHVIRFYDPKKDTHS